MGSTTIGAEINHLKLPTQESSETPTLKKHILFYAFQLIAIAWAGVVLLRTVTLGWSPFASMGLAVLGALPISFLGIRIDSKKKKARIATASQP